MFRPITIPEPVTIRHKGYFRDGFLAMIVAGGSGCGKSRWMASVLPFISDSIKTVIIATIIKDAPVHKAICDYFTKRGCLTGIESEPADMYELVEICREKGIVTPTRPGLICFDDFATRASGTGPHWEFIIYAASKLRNNGWNFITITQRPTFIPPIVRDCSTGRVLFNCYTSSAISTFLSDLKRRVANPEHLESLVSYITNTHFTYIYVREFPLEVCVGKGSEARVVLRQQDTVIPTLNDIKKELGLPPTATEADVREFSGDLQRRVGNTSSRL
jgi:hypothetical protein